MSNRIQDRLLLHNQIHIQLSKHHPLFGMWQIFSHLPPIRSEYSRVSAARRVEHGRLLRPELLDRGSRNDRRGVQSEALRLHRVDLRHGRDRCIGHAVRCWTTWVRSYGWPGGDVHLFALGVGPEVVEGVEVFP